MIKIALGGYITLWLGYTMAMVGKMPELDYEPYHWSLVPKFALIFIIPAVLGYIAGREDASQPQKSEQT